MQDALMLIQNRKSSRMPFDLERPVAKQDLLKILEAARWSLRHNMQNFEIIVVDDKKVLKLLKYKTSDFRNLHPGKLSATVFFRRRTVEEKNRRIRSYVSTILEKPEFQAGRN